MGYPQEQPEISGWMALEELNWLYSEAQKHKLIVEIGSWKGRSTRALLEGAKLNGGTVYAIDHWLGSINEIQTAHKEVLEKDIFEEFKKNVGHYNNLVIMEMCHKNAAKSFEDQSVDMVFIDGCHLPEKAKHDIVSWIPKTKTLLCGHDYEQTKIKEIAQETGLNLVRLNIGSLWKLEA